MTYAQGQTTSHPFRERASSAPKCGDGHTLIKPWWPSCCCVWFWRYHDGPHTIWSERIAGHSPDDAGSHAQGQIDSLLLGESRDITCTAEALRVEGGVHAWETPQSCPHVQANIVRWRDGLDAVRLRVTPPFGAPNAAGSVTLLPGGGGHVVVVRASSGLTRREAQ